MTKLTRWPASAPITTMSTAHLTQTTKILLRNNQDGKPFGLPVYPKNSTGWFIDVSDNAMTALDRESVPIDLYTCLCLANLYANNAPTRRAWLCFDPDADLLAGIPWYDHNGTAHLTAIYTAYQVENQASNQYYSLHQILLTENETKAIALLEEGRNRLIKQYYQGDTEYRQVYDPIQKTWTDQKGYPHIMKGGSD